MLEDFVTYSAIFTEPSDPATLDEIMNRSDKDFWLQAIDDEKLWIVNGCFEPKKEIAEKIVRYKAKGCQVAEF